MHAVDISISLVKRIEILYTKIVLHYILIGYLQLYYKDILSLSTNFFQYYLQPFPDRKLSYLTECDNIMADPP